MATPWSAFPQNEKLLKTDQIVGLFGGENGRKPLTSLGGVTVFNPENYSAVGNGVSNDISYLQDLVDEAEGEVVKLKPNTIYRIDTTLLIPHSITIEGPKSSVIYMAGDNLHAIRITGDDVVLKGFTVRGNNSGLGGVVTDVEGGHGIAIDASENVLLSRLRFEAIGIEDPEHGNYACPISGFGVDGATVEKCYFSNSCINRTGADIQLTGKNISIQNSNRSRSYCDSFVSLGAEGENVRHIVKGNFAYRAADAISRSAVLYQYDADSPAFADISHNQFEGFVWHGVYGTAQAGTPGGGVTVSHNHIRYCGGGSADLDADTGDWPGSAVKCGGSAGAVIHGNNIFGAGYDSEGVARTLTCVGLLIYTGGTFSTANIIASKNIVRGSSGAGIGVIASGTSGAISDCLVEGNNVHDNQGVGIEIIAQSSGIECIKDLTIRGNKVKVSNDVRGIALTSANGGWSNRVNIDDNEVIHSSPPGSGDVAGIYRDGYSDYTRHTGRVKGNTVKGFRTGISIPSTVTLYSPFAVRVSDNTIEDANLAMGLGGGSVYWGLHEGTIARNCTTIQTSRTRTGRLLGPAASGRYNVEMYQLNLINAVPPDGAWTVGDRVYMQFKAGPIVGYECVTAGSVGTWRPIYHYGQGGNVFSCSATPITGSTTISTNGMSAWSATGTPTSASYANTNRYTRMSRVEFLDTSAGTDSIAGFQNVDLGWLLNTGFYVRFVWGLATGVSITTGRAFCGLVASTAAPTDVDPSTLLNMIGMGWDDDDTNVQIMRNDASDAATKIDLGSNFPVPTSDGTQVYTLELISMGTGTGIQYSVTNETTGVSARGSFATDLPNGGTSPLAPQIWSSVGGTSGVTGVAFGGFYGERPN